MSEWLVINLLCFEKRRSKFQVDLPNRTGNTTRWHSGVLRLNWPFRLHLAEPFNTDVYFAIGELFQYSETFLLQRQQKDISLFQSWQKQSHEKTRVMAKLEKEAWSKWLLIQEWEKKQRSLEVCQQIKISHLQILFITSSNRCNSTTITLITLCFFNTWSVNEYRHLLCNPVCNV